MMGEPPRPNESPPETDAPNKKAAVAVVSAASPVVVPDKAEAFNAAFVAGVLEGWFKKNDQDPALVQIR